MKKIKEIINNILGIRNCKTYITLFIIMNILITSIYYILTKSCYFILLWFINDIIGVLTFYTIGYINSKKIL